MCHCNPEVIKMAKEKQNVLTSFSLVLLLWIIGEFDLGFFVKETCFFFRMINITTSRHATSWVLPGVRQIHQNLCEHLQKARPFLKVKNGLWILWIVCHYFGEIKTLVYCCLRPGRLVRVFSWNQFHWKIWTIFLIILDFFLLVKHPSFLEESLVLTCHMCFT